ncbi:hypothetical protein NXS19_003832 [Fusarium pseudograminearum]|nr:hypothetical protein NXS19_003832 [Fusarium pseudograminearum]
MALQKSLLQYICSFLLLVSSVSALKFDLIAGSKERCVRNFVGKDTLVVVTATVDGYKGDGMVVNLYIRDAVGNEYGRPRDVVGESRTVFTSHADAAFDVCFENVPSGSQRLNSPTRHIELDIDIGADAKDWSAIQATEKLKPVEAELRRVLRRSPASLLLRWSTSVPESRSSEIPTRAPTTVSSGSVLLPLGSSLVSGLGKSCTSAPTSDPSILSKRVFLHARCLRRRSLVP